MTTLSLAFVLLLVSPLALAYGTLNNDKSHISFISTKNGDIAEPHTFNRLGGKVDEVGNAESWIDLTSFDTNIAIRDERMQKFLFETGLYPKAVITVSIADRKQFNRLDDMSVGEQAVENFQGTLDLHMCGSLNRVRFRISCRSRTPSLSSYYLLRAA